MIENFIGKLDDAEYRARQRGDTPAIGGSGLVLIERNSPAHHVANQASMRESKPGAFGSLVHCLVLEPETFAGRYYVRPDVVERESVPEPRQVKAAAGPTPYKVATPELHKRDALEVVLLEGFEIYKTGAGAWSFPMSSLLDETDTGADRVWQSKVDALDAVATLNPYAFSDYRDATLRFPARDVADHAARVVDGGRWIIVDAEPHTCEACAGAGCYQAEDPAVITTECFRCEGSGLVLGFATQSEAKAHAAALSGWTVDGVEFHKTKKALLEAAAASSSGEPSGWTVDGVEFYSTKKALLEQSDACHRWALVGAVESGPWYRTRDDAAAACVELAGGREVVSLADFARAGDAVDAAAAHPVAGALLNACDAFELSVLWHDIANGVDCSGQLDAYAANTDGIDLPGVYIEPGRRVGIDLKTTGRLVTPGTESRIVLDGGHHIQAAHYMDGCEANGKPLDAWIMIYVETKAPYGVRVVQLGETFLALGRYRRGLALAKVAAWNALPANADPPSYEPACVTVEPPARAVPDVVGDADWSDWMEASKTSAREAAIQAARDEHADAEDDTSRIEGALTALFDGRAKMARRAVELANDGEYSAALAASDGIIGVDDKIAALRHEHATAEIRTAKAWAALQGVRNG